jgi:hypothetical protein
LIISEGEMGRGGPIPEGWPKRGGAYAETKEYVDLMAHLADPRGGDPEGMHSHAEKLLCAYLRSVGLFQVADAWENAKDVQGWWYA